MAGSDLPSTDTVYCYKDRPSDANKNPAEIEDEDCKVAFIIDMDNRSPSDDDGNSEPEAEQYEKFQKLPNITNRSIHSLESHLSSYLSLMNALKQISVAVSCVILAVIFNLTVLAVIHERVPDTAPLPDVAFTLLPKIDYALDISEYIIMFVTTILFIVVFAHRFRSILIRRLLLVLSFLYVFRAICMAVTQLPVANPKYYCSPKLNLTTNQFGYIQFAGIVLSRVTHMSLGMGLSVNGRHSFCGDYIFSGHTLILVISYLFISEYWLDNNRTRHLHWRFLRYIFLMLIIIGIIGIVLARGHYMIDIVLAYYISTRIFLLYHKACDDIYNNPMTELDNTTIIPTTAVNIYQSNTVCHNRFADSLWWFPIFQFVESDTIQYRIPIENHFDLHTIIKEYYEKLLQFFKN